MTHTRRIYVASSWRNLHQPAVVTTLREAGHEVYDFRNPPGASGFSWHQIDPDWERWTPSQFRDSLAKPRSQEGLQNDYEGMQWADTVVLVQPCGRSAHLELGWGIGARKATAVLLAPHQEPELMLGLADYLCLDLPELLAWLQKLPPFPRCGRCDGCGRIASGEEGAPWTAWVQLPRQSKVAVLAGIVQPIPCPSCKGTGRAEDLRP